MKQVIILRKDLNMRKGKMVAQGAHASLKAVLSDLDRSDTKEWLNSGMTKITVSVDSEQDLFKAYHQAKALGLMCSLIEDLGRTEFENDRFRVFYIRHKYNDKMHRVFGFNKCRATPLMPIWHANGDISLCVDRKNDPSMVFGSHKNISDITKIWGSAKHKEVIDNIKLEECPKCTFNEYNTQIEKAVIENRMDFEFC